VAKDVLNQVLIPQYFKYIWERAGREALADPKHPLQRLKKTPGGIPHEQAEALPDGRLRIHITLPDGTVLVERFLPPGQWRWLHS